VINEAEKVAAAAVATFTAEHGRWPTFTEAAGHLAGAAVLPYYEAAQTVWRGIGDRVRLRDGVLVLPEWAHLDGDLRWPARAVRGHWDRLARV
jgi:hypothetical protein